MTRRPLLPPSMMAMLASALLTPLILNLSPTAGSSLPIPMAATAAVGISAG